MAEVTDSRNLTPEQFIAAINREIETRVRTFSGDQSVLESFLNRSKDVVSEYNGRQIFEMLQNVDDQLDASPVDCLDEDRERSRFCQIEFNEDAGTLVFRNKGRPFSCDGVKSIMYPDRSPKKKEGKLTIGNKGLGFRSLLNWQPARIVIRSNGLSFSFSNEDVKGALDRHLNIDRRIEFNLPMLTFPTANRDLERQTAWTTEIELSGIPLEVRGQIREELEKFEAEVMLFLPKLRWVEILLVKSGTCTDYHVWNLGEPKVAFNLKEGVSARIVERRIEKLVGEKQVFQTEWLAYHEEGVLPESAKTQKDDSLNYKLAIAIPRDASKRDLFQHLYNYLPLRNVSLKLPCLVHATVVLDGPRDNLLIDHPANQKIFEHLLPGAFARVATELTKGALLPGDWWLPYRLLLPPRGYEFELNNLVRKLYAALDDVRTNGCYCPCVDGMFRKPSDCCYCGPDPDGQDRLALFFNDHPKILENHVRSGGGDGLRDVNDRVDEERLQRHVNANITTWNLDDNELGDLVYSLWRIHRRNDAADKRTYAVLRGESGYFAGDAIVYELKPDAVNVQPPEFMHFDFLKKSIWEKLCEKFKAYVEPDPSTDTDDDASQAARNLSRKICHLLQEVVPLQHYDAANIKAQMIRQCAEHLKETVDAMTRRTLVRQLFKALLAYYNPNDPRNRDRYRTEPIPLIVEEDGMVRYAHEYLFESAHGIYDSVLPPEVFLGEAKIRELFEGLGSMLVGKTQEGFLGYLGVRKDVRIVYKTITAVSDAQDYFAFLSKLPENEGGLGVGGELKKDLRGVPTLVDAQSVGKLPAERILRLLVADAADNGLLALLQKTPSILWRPRIKGQRNAVPYDIGWSLLAFQMRGVLKSCIFDEMDRTLASIGFCFANQQDFRAVPDSVLLRLGARRQLKDMLPSQLYDLLKQVQRAAVVPTKDFYKKINAAFGACEARKEGFTCPQDLQLYATDLTTGVSAYYPTGDIVYHDNPSHVRALLKDGKLLYMSSRCGADNVERRFGVKKIVSGQVERVDLTPLAEAVQSEFNGDFERKKPCFKAILRRHRGTARDLSEEGEKSVDDVQIVVASKLAYVDKASQPHELNVADYIRDPVTKGKFYLAVGEDVRSFADIGAAHPKYRALCQGVAGILCDVVNLSDEKLEREFRDCYYDVEKVRADLEEDGLLENGDLPPPVVQSRFCAHLEEARAMVRDLWQSRILPSLWCHLNQDANRAKQKDFQSYINAFQAYSSALVAGEGALACYCREKQLESLSSEDVRKKVVSVLTQANWANLQLDWATVADEEFNRRKVPGLREFYPQLVDSVEAAEDTELLSLLFFRGNEQALQEGLLARQNELSPVSPMSKESSGERELKRVSGSISFTKVRASSGMGGGGHRKGTGKAMSQKRQANQKKAGNDAEDAVLAWLKKQPGVTEARRVSGDADSADRNDGLHYDIEYKANGTLYYVEVKSCENGLFHISSGEYAFAVQNATRYQLALVFADGTFELLTEKVSERIKDCREATEWVVGLRNYETATNA